VGVNRPTGNVTQELGLRNRKEDKVITEECVKQRLIPRKSVLHCENFKTKVVPNLCEMLCVFKNGVLSAVS
jgi:hypothetical protein